MSYLICFWIFYNIPAAVLSLPIMFFGRGRVHWDLWELLAFVVPFAAWVAAHYLLLASEDSKGIANIFNEPFLVGFTIPAAALARVILGKGKEEDQRTSAMVVLVCLAIAGALVYLVTPNLHGTI